MNITLLGCGRWGSFIGWYLDKIGHKVKIWGLADALSSKLKFVQMLHNL